MIKFLMKFAYFRKLITDAAFKVTYVDREENAILKYVLSDSKGRKYFKYIRPDLLPLPRYEQMDIRLLEIQSRISRETLKLYADANKLAAENKDFLAVARLAGELNDRLEILYDPEVMMRFICGLLIREDQVKTAHIWNQDLENEKFESLKKDFDGRLSFFFQQTSLTDHVSFSNSSVSDLGILTEEIIQNQMKMVKAFDSMLRKSSDHFKTRSSSGKKKESVT